MIQRRRLTINIASSSLQVAGSGAVFLLLYRFLIHTIGIERLGTWSLVQSITLASSFADFGLTGGVLRYVAKYNALGDRTRAAEIVETSVVSVALLFAVACSVSYPLFRLLLETLLPVRAIQDAWLLLPYSLIVLWISSVGNVFLASLDGLQQNAKRSAVMFASGCLFLGLATLFVPALGLYGLALSQVCQASFALGAGWLLLRREMRGLRPYPHRWQRNVFSEIARYSGGLQLTNMSGMLFDPVTKSLLSKFGGLSAVGYYEMANRLVMQLRSMIVSANQVLVPVIAGVHETHPENLPRIYKSSSRAIGFVALPAYATLVFLAPTISHVWLGAVNAEFVRFSLLLVVGWLVNTLAGPAYFANVGTGHLRWNVLGQLSIGALNLLLGYVLGAFAGGTGVVWGWVIALVAGSCLIVSKFGRAYGLSALELFPKENRRLALGCVLALALGFESLSAGDRIGNQYLAFAIAGSLFGLPLTYFVWRDPMRARVVSWVKSGRKRLAPTLPNS